MISHQLSFERLGVEIEYSFPEADAQIVNAKPQFGLLPGSEDDVFINIDTHLAPPMPELPHVWTVGMRVEAWDRRTPSLVCVATVGM